MCSVQRRKRITYQRNHVITNQKNEKEQVVSNNAKHAVARESESFAEIGLWTDQPVRVVVLSVGLWGIHKPNREGERERQGVSLRELESLCAHVPVPVRVGVLE